MASPSDYALEGQTPLIDKIEEVAVTCISTMRHADKFLGEAERRGHQPFSAISLDSRTKARAVAYEGKGPCDAITVTEAGLLFSARLS